MNPNLQTQMQQLLTSDADMNNNEINSLVREFMDALNSGEVRVAHKISTGWQVNQWVKQGILSCFKHLENHVIPGEYCQYFDKIDPQFKAMDESDWRAKQIRSVPQAYVRDGSHIGKSCVLMPCFVNIGAFIDTGCMIDTWATVGSCAQIGKNVHISGGAGIGGVLEPLQATPTIIEDNCFIGARSEIVEGVVVEENSVIAMGVFISQSTPIYDRTQDKIITGRVPAGSVVIPGSLPSKCGKYNRNAAIIVKQVDSKTRSKTGINTLLREACEA
jgi:2,3,4,5-tetrahydropyridine-2,6-dicarboxylate N-succinyltransferase